MQETEVVQTVHGKVRGVKLNTHHGIAYYSFRGIPYAKPPVGPLRFQPPEPAEPWEDIRDAIQLAPMAPQTGLFANNQYGGDEDCLYINVFTTQLAMDKGTNLKPVLVYIHGGGFGVGSGNNEMHGPGRIMTKGEVVLVTMNYRLGVLGFLSTGDSVVPGNNGLKDQVLSLKWIQQNIEKFGGDPENVTIAGVSAGGSSVHLHLVSPMSKGLFHKAIAQSSTGYSSWCAQDADYARSKAFRLGAALGIKTNDSKELVASLMKLSAKELVEGVDKALLEDEKHPAGTLFLPVIEKGEHSANTFLPEKPVNIIRTGTFNSVPIITGIASREGLLIMGDVEQSPQYWYGKWNEDFDPALKIYFGLQEDTPQTREIGSKIREYYFGDKGISKQTTNKLVDLFGDMLINVGTDIATRELVKFSKEPLYYYQFSFIGEFSFSMKGEGFEGANHGSDVGYLFETMFNPVHYLDSESETMNMSEKMLRMWTNFVKTGNPTPVQDTLLAVTWKPCTLNESYYLDIDNPLTMKKDLNKERMEFWNRILSDPRCSVATEGNTSSAAVEMQETEVVQTVQGKVKGVKLKTHLGIPYYSFTAIPYAKPPVGPLRFKSPEPAESWEGIRDATEVAKAAPQISFFTNQYEGDEDCLYINVYTPQIPNDENTVLKPVMAYIHGGGYFAGKGDSTLQGPGRIMSKGDVVLVTMNYRLGVLGFLSTGDSVVPGNYGMKDQVLSLKWIQQNIAKFGGDPGNVTIAGVSAGGSAAHLHLFSPMSKGLFHKAIAESGSAFSGWSAQDPEYARSKAFRLGETLGIKTNDSKELLEFLMTISAKELIDAQLRTLTEDEKHPLPGMFFLPVVERDQHTDDTFLPDKPLDFMRKGKYNSVPLISGISSREGLIISGDFPKSTSWYEGLSDDLEPILTFQWGLKNGTPQIREYTKKTKHFYFGDKRVSKETLNELVDLYGDIMFNVGADKAAKEHVKFSKEPIYYYQFSFNGEFTSLFDSCGLEGAFHGAEMVYIFETIFHKVQYLDPESETMKMSEKMLRMWINFAKTGNPTPKEDPLLGVIWKPYTLNEANYLDIDNPLVVKTDLFKERMDFWDTLFSE